MAATHRLPRQFLIAQALSAAAFAACVLVQGFFLFPRSLETWSGRDPTFIRRFSCLSDGRAVAHFTVAPPVEARLRSYIAIWNLAERPPVFALPDLGITPWRIACSRTSHVLFLVTSDGALYSVDLDAPSYAALHLGSLQHVCPTLLECSPDGALVLVGGMNTVSLWNRDNKKCLWRRTDLDVTCATFAPDSRRLFCGLESGQVFEVDWATGQTLRQVASHLSYCTGIVVSPAQDRLASIDWLGHLTMTDLDARAVLWRKQHAVLVGGKPTVMPVCPRFSPSGRELFLVCAARHGQVVVCEASTGRELEASTWVCSDIKGCTVAADGTCYFWDDEGTISAWNRELRDVWHFSPRVEAGPRTRQRQSPPHDA